MKLNQEALEKAYKAGYGEQDEDPIIENIMKAAIECYLKVLAQQEARMWALAYAEGDPIAVHDYVEKYGEDDERS